MNLKLLQITEARALLVQAAINFERIARGLLFVDRISRAFIDASAGAVVQTLPDGNVGDVSYYFIKTDSSVNTITIQAATGQTIQGSATATLSAQYDRLWLTFDKGTQTWYQQ